MNQLVTGEAPEAAASRLQKELAEVLRQREAISAVLRAIANSPHDLRPIFDTILDSAVRLCRAEECGGVYRLAEEGGFRLVAHNLTPAVLAQYRPPTVYEHGSFLGRLLASKSPVHIPDLTAELRRAGEADRIDLSKAGPRTCLFVPMLRNDEQIGSLGLGRRRIEPFTEKEIKLVTDFAAQAAVALDITRCERKLRELQMELARAS